MPKICISMRDKPRWQRELKPAPRKDVPEFLRHVQPHVSEFMRYMLPHLKPIKKLEKAERKSRNGGAKADTEAYMRSMMGACPEKFREKVCFVSDWGTVVEEVSIKVEEVKLAVEEEKHTASGKAKLPIALIGIATFLVCAVCSVFGLPLTGLFGMVGIAAVAGTWLAMGIASFAVDKLFSKRERALATWEKAVSRVEIPPTTGGWLPPGQEN